MSRTGVNGPADSADTDEARVAAALAAAGRPQQPTDEQLARWRGRFEAELAAVRARRRRSRLVMVAAACAATVALVVGWLVGPGVDPGPAPPAVAQVRTAFGGIMAYLANERMSLRAGDSIVAGQRVESGFRSGLGVAYGGVDVRLDAQTVVVFHGQHLQLTRGRLYLDTGVGPPSSPAVSVVTPRGEFSHVGTQFVVGVNGDEVLGAVREGRIALQAKGGRVMLQAGRDTARMVVVRPGGQVSRSDIAPTGMLWSWALQSSGGLNLAGRSADEVLQWAAREQGRRLVYADERSRRAARNARLSGSGRSVGPDQALKFVTAATRLRVVEPSPAVLQVVLSERDENAH